MPFGATGGLTVSKADHEAYTASVTVSRGDTLRHDLTLVTTLTTGTV